jgi:hypothetical protein
MVRTRNSIEPTNIYFLNKVILKSGSNRSPYFVLQILNDRIVQGGFFLYPLLKHIFLADISGEETIKEEDLPLFRADNDSYFIEANWLGQIFLIQIRSKKKLDKYLRFSETIIELCLYPENRSKEKIQKLLEYIQAEMPNLLLKLSLI